MSRPFRTYDRQKVLTNTEAVLPFRGSKWGTALSDATLLSPPVTMMKFLTSYVNFPRSVSCNFATLYV